MVFGILLHFRSQQRLIFGSVKTEDQKPEMNASADAAKPVVSKGYFVSSSTRRYAYNYKEGISGKHAVDIKVSTPFLDQEVSDLRTCAYTCSSVLPD